MTRQGTLRVLSIFGLGVAYLGAAAGAIGAVLPWARIPLFGAEFSAPGVAGIGALALVGAALAILHTHRFPLLGVLLGLILVGLGWQGQTQTGKQIKGQLLAVNRSLWFINDKLMRVGMQPVEPFPAGRTWDSLVGPGPKITFWGGAVLTVGSSLAFAGRRLRRTCPHCAASWSANRTDAVTFCPICGKRVGEMLHCPACHTIAARGDRHCVACGTDLRIPSH